MPHQPGETDDVVVGTEGDDGLRPNGGGHDTIYGLGGNDTYFIYATGHTIVEEPNEGYDLVWTDEHFVLPPNVEALRGDSFALHMEGRSGGLTLTGNELDNLIIGTNQNDVLIGGAGADQLIGGAASDGYYVDNPSDVVVEEQDQGTGDTIATYISYTLPSWVENIQAAAPESTDPLALTGNELGNVIRGNAGANVMTGRAGDDIYYAEAGDTVVEAPAEGTDEVRTSLASYVLGDNVENLTGLSAGGQRLTGNAAANVVTGNAGDDVLNGAGGADRLVGGAGHDLYYVDNAGDVVVELASQGVDRVATTVDYTLSDNVENLQANDIAGTAPLSLTGNALANNIYGTQGDNVLNGAGGADFMVGYAGHDLYYVDNANDVAYEEANGGTDRVSTTVSYTLGANVENLQANDIGGTAALSLTGNSLANNIYGTQGDNVLNGAGGADFMAGYGGNDLYYVDHAGDVAYEEANGGIDRVVTAVSYALGANVENLQANDIGGTAALTLAGNDLGNSIWGTNGNNVIAGRGGIDHLFGYGGSDQFLFDTAPSAATNYDFIGDFQGGVDKIALDNSVFTALSDGALPASAFVSGTAAADADDRIVYNPANGALFYDADGSGAGAQVLIAFVSSTQPLTAADILVV